MTSGRRGFVWVGALALASGACASGGPVEIRDPRPLINLTGQRLLVDKEQMREINDWVVPAVEAIETDPSFVVDYRSVPEPVYPWQTFAFAPNDTVRVAWEAGVPDVRTTYWIYAFLHQMHRMGRLVDWFSEAEALEGWELELFIVERTADSWLLGRTTFDTQPYAKLDELIYAHDRGQLEALVLYTRPGEFPEAEEAFLDADPDGFEAFEAWYRETWGRDPPPRGSGG